MSEKVRVKINIAGRPYPLTVSAEEEEGIRKASEKIDSLISQFQKNYAINDSQDVLAMCALQIATELEMNKIRSNSNENSVENKIDSLIQLVNEGL